MSERFINIRTVRSGLSSARKAVAEDRMTGRDVFVKFDNLRALRDEFRRHSIIYQLSRSNPRPDIIIPEPIGLFTISGHTALVLQYLPGAANMLQVSEIDRTRRYIKIVKYLESLSGKTPVKLPVKPAWMLLLSSPLYFFRSFLAYPGRSGLLFRALFFIWRHAGSWITLSSDCLVHGDINVANVLTFRTRTVLVDFSESCRSHRYYNLAQSLNSSWNHSEFYRHYWFEQVRSFRLDNHEQSVLKSFVILNLLQRLTARLKKRDQADIYFNRLNTLAHDK